MKGLLIRSPWIEEILQGRKTWEIRGSKTKVRGPIALIRSGSGLIVGMCELIDVIGPLSRSDFEQSVTKHRIPLEILRTGSGYRTPYAWVIRHAKSLREPVRYIHPKGAIIWVNLPDSVLSCLE